MNQNNSNPTLEKMHSNKGVDMSHPWQMVPPRPDKNFQLPFQIRKLEIPENLGKHFGLSATGFILPTNTTCLSSSKHRHLYA